MRARVIVLSGLLTLALCPVLSWVCPPQAFLRDEFSYLLAGDTFAEGRLTNPAHPLWDHFEAPQITQQPTYHSRYPPGQGLFLAAGQVLTGQPIAGVWLSMALASAATCWMLLAWMPPRWALLGALLPVVRFGTLPMWDHYMFTYWATSFWGGAVAMIGGALLFGAVARLVREPRAREAGLLALGLIVLANTRPYEGLVAALPAAFALLVWGRWPVIRRATLPATAVLAVGFAAMGYYNWRTTGDALKMPYVAHTEQYEMAPLLIFQSPKDEKTYRHVSIARYQYLYMMAGYRMKASGGGLSAGHLDEPLRFFWGPLLCLSAVVALLGPMDRWAWFSAAAIVLQVLANAISVSDVLRPHYLAPVAPLLVYLPVAGIRRMRAFRWSGRGVGRPAAELVIALCLLSFPLSAARRYFAQPLYQTPLAEHRPRMERLLEARPGKDLVIVRYGMGPVLEWVYNAADIDAASIVWAQDMGNKNQELLDYYSGRTAWLLWASENPPRLEPYR